MERTHGWHQRDSGFSAAIITDGAVQSANRSGDDWG
jgi:hypothetical protein